MARRDDEVPDEAAASGKEPTSDRAGKKGKGTAREPAKDEVKVGKAPKPVTQQVGRVAVIAATGIFVLFALFNAQYVDFSWVFGSTEVITQGKDRISGGVPLIILLVASFVLGGVVGTGVAQRRHKIRQLRKQ